MNPTINTKKICLLGHFSVGKTSLVARFVRQTFSENYLTTVGVKIDTKVVVVTEDQKLKLVIWDISGSDELSDNDINYLRGSSGIFFVVDGTRKETLDAIPKLKDTVDRHLSDCTMICAINKSDLENSWEIAREDIDGLKCMGIPTFRTSAKTGKNVENAFVNLCQMLI